MAPQGGQNTSRHKPQAHLQAIILEAARSSPQLEEVLGQPPFADDEEILHAVTAWEPNEQLWKLLGHSAENAQHLAGIARKIAMPDEAEGRSGWIPFLLGLAVGLGALILICYGLWLDFFQYVDWDSDRCQLLDFSSIGAERTVFGPQCRSNTGECFFDVRIVRAGLTKFDWRLPFSQSYGDAYEGGFEITSKPFRCCNTTSTEGCCAMYEPRSYLFCDNWGILGPDSIGRDCPGEPWPCLYKVKSSGSGTDEVTDLKVYEDPDTAVYYICGCLMLPVSPLLVFRWLRETAFFLGVDIYFSCKSYLLRMQDCFRDRSQITVQAYSEEQGHKQHHFAKRKSLRRSATLTNITKAARKVGLPKSSTRRGSLFSMDTVQEGEWTHRHVPRRPSLMKSRWSMSVQTGRRTSTIGSRSVLGSEGGATSRGKSTSAAVDTSSAQGHQDNHRSHLEDLETGSLSFDGELRRIAVARAQEGKTALRPIITPMWSKQQRRKLERLSSTSHATAMGDLGGAGGAFPEHQPRRGSVRGGERQHAEPAEPPLQNSFACPHRAPMQHYQHHGAQDAAEWHVQPAGGAVFGGMAYPREAWGEGGEEAAAGGALPPSIAGHWASQASIGGRRASMLARKSRKPLAVKTPKEVDIARKEDRIKSHRQGKLVRHGDKLIDFRPQE